MPTFPRRPRYPVTVSVPDNPLAVGTGDVGWVVPAGLAGTILTVTANVATAPTGASLIVDVHRNGTTIFTTQGNRPTIAASSTASSDATPDVTALAAGDVLRADIDQVGSTEPGELLVVTITVEL